MSKQIGRRDIIESGFKMARCCGLFGLFFGLAVLSIFPAAAAHPFSAPAVFGQKNPPAPSAVLDLASVLPASGEAAGWTRKGDPQLFKGKDLFTYNDGGADIYIEYGFRQLVVQDYENALHQTTTLEIFEMADAAAAFGIFTFKSSAGGTAITLGQGGRLEDYYLNFWKGPVLVTVTGFDDSPASLEGVRRVAGATDRKLALLGERPALAAAFPADWAPRGGLKYIRGPLGLRNLHPVFVKSAIGFSEGIAGWPAESVLAVVLRGGGAAGAKGLFSDAQKLFSSSPQFSGYRTDDARFDARDAKDDFVEGRRLDGCVALIVSNGPLTDSEKIWARLAEAFGDTPAAKSGT